MAQSNTKSNGFFKVYVIDALSYMAMGLFCSLILGLINTKEMYGEKYIQIQKK